MENAMCERIVLDTHIDVSMRLLDIAIVIILHLSMREIYAVQRLMKNRNYAESWGMYGSTKRIIAIWFRWCRSCGGFGKGCKRCGGYTSESDYGYKSFWNKICKKGSNGRWGAGPFCTFFGFIYNPAIEDVVENEEIVCTIQKASWFKAGDVASISNDAVYYNCKIVVSKRLI